jgi:hypothetical protein
VSTKKPSKVVTVEMSVDMIYEGIIACAVSAADEAKSRDARIASWGLWIPKLHSAKVVIGRRNGKNPCVYAQAFYDAQVAQGLTPKTASNYLTLFKACVESGELPTDSNMHRKPKAKGKAKSKTKDPKAFSSVFAQSFNYNEGKAFEDLCNEVEASFEDAKFDTIYEAFTDFLKREGFEIEA